MTHADRFAVALQATWHLFAAFVLLLGVAYVAARAWQARPQRNPFDAWGRAGRKPGEIDG